MVKQAVHKLTIRALQALHAVRLSHITMKHHWTGAPVYLDAYLHKGYWFHGRNREAEMMRCFQRFVQPGDTVWEIGGHIGYISLLFAAQVGEAGRVHVFEPGPNNLPYLLRNTRRHANITVHQKAVGKTPGEASFFLDNLTGQNNSLVADYEILSANAKAAGVAVRTTEIKVKVITLDQFYAEQQVAPSLVKVDVEGFEWEVLQGMASLLKSARPIVTVEISEHLPDVFDWMTQAGYRCFAPNGQPIQTCADLNRNSDTIWLHVEKHSSQIESFGKRDRVSSL